jgi:hypothetical protein
MDVFDTTYIVLISFIFILGGWEFIWMSNLNGTEGNETYI